MSQHTRIPKMRLDALTDGVFAVAMTRALSLERWMKV
jgi:uncharacterized membrane protein